MTSWLPGVPAGAPDDRRSGAGTGARQHGWRVWWYATIREQGACVKAVYDLAIRRPPVFLGPHEPGIDNALRGG